MIKETPNSARWGKFAHTLMATTCLTVGAGTMASGSTSYIIEGTAPAPADFPDTSPGYLLPFGTNVVQGQLHQDADNNDWFEFQGLFAGHSYSLHATYNPLGQERGVSMEVFTSTGTRLGGATLESSGGIVTGTIPGDGELVVNINFAETGAPTWQVALTAETGAPEPSTFLGTALGLAGALAWRRKRALQS